MKARLDHELHAALDTCLSGTDSLPSQRESILQKAQMHKAAFTLPRAGIIIAFALLLTVISGAMAGTFNGIINWRGEPDDSAVPKETPYAVQSNSALPVSMHTALSHLSPEDDRYARRVFYTDANGMENFVHGSIGYRVSSLEELEPLFADSELMLPQGLRWPVDDPAACYAYVAVECLSSGTYEKVGETVFDDGTTLELYQPEKDARLVSSLQFAGWTEDKWLVNWTAQYQRNSDSLGFPLTAGQQVQQLDVPGMTDAIAVTEANRTTIYMRKALETPIEYNTFFSMFIEAENRTAPRYYDEIFYKISGVAQSVEDLLSLLPQ